MPLTDLKDHALSGEDFYGLLDLHPAASESEVRRAYRRVALKYHPDKNPGNTAAIEKFHLLQIANDVLSDAEARGIYDNARKAKLEKAERERAFDAQRKRMVDALEKGEREGGVKRMKRTDDEEREARMRQEISQLRQDSARRVREKRENMMREADLEESIPTPTAPRAGSQHANGSTTSETRMEIPETDRTVKVTWKREGDGLLLDEARLEELFGRFGKLKMVMIREDKRRRLAEGEDKVLMGKAMLVYTSVASAYAAVEDGKKLSEDALPSLESVTWLRGEEPAAIKNLAAKAMGLATDEAAAALSKEDSTRIRLRLAAKRQKEAKAAQESNGGQETQPSIRKVRSFASFKGISTPQYTPQKAPPKFSISTANTPVKGSCQSPGVARVEKTRMREEERKKLEEEILRREAEEG